MKYGIFSDIHANLEAFQAVLAELEGVDAYLCLGDLVGYGPNPNECVELVAGLPNCSCVVGNHDLAAVDKYDINWFNPLARQAIMWTQQQLTERSRLLIEGLPAQRTVDGITLVHGALPDPMDYLTSPWEAIGVFSLLQTRLCFIGHTHVAEYYAQGEGAATCRHAALASGGEIALEPGVRYIVNCGAVGQPRDGSPLASFGIYHQESDRIEIRRIPYPLEETQRKMRVEGLPEFLIDRLRVGR